MKFEFQGLVAAPFTPMKENGDIDLSKIPAYVQHLSDEGVDGVFINGTTGEGILSLTVKERKDLTEAWVEAGKGKISTIIVQVGTTTKDCALHYIALYIILNYFVNYITLYITLL